MVNMDRFQQSNIKDLTTIKRNFFGEVLLKIKPMWTLQNNSKVLKLLQDICGSAMEVLDSQYKIYFDLTDEEIDFLHRDTGN